MFGATGNEQVCPSDDPGNDSAHQRPGVPGGIDVAVVQHDVAVAANVFRRSGIGLGRHGQQVAALCIGQLPHRRQFSIRQCTDHRRQIDFIAAHSW